MDHLFLWKECNKISVEWSLCCNVTELIYELCFCQAIVAFKIISVRSDISWICFWCRSNSFEFRTEIENKYTCNNIGMSKSISLKMKKIKGMLFKSSFINIMNFKIQSFIFYLLTGSNKVNMQTLWLLIELYFHRH